MMKITSAQDVALLAELRGEPYERIKAFLIQFTMSDGVMARYVCAIFDDYRGGWAECAMVEFIVEHLPEAARFKLEPSFHGPCLFSLGDSAEQSTVGYLALYPQVGVPVSALPGAVDLDFSAWNLCSAVLEHLEAMSASTSLSCHLHIANPLASDYLIDIPNKRIWLQNFSQATLVWSDCFGTSVMSPLRDFAAELPMDNVNDQLAVILNVVRALVDFGHNTAKSADAKSFQDIATFLASKKTTSLKSCIAFFKEQGSLLEGIHTSPSTLPPQSPSSSSSSSPLAALAASSSHSQQLIGIGRRNNTKESAEARAIAAAVPKYTKSSVVPASPTVLSVSDLQLNPNPVGTINDIFQRLTGKSPQFKDEGRTGGADHVPRFGCGFTLPNGDYISAEGSSKQEAKTNVAYKVLEILSRTPLDSISLHK